MQPDSASRRLGGAGGGFQNPLPPPAMLGNGPVGGVPTVAASPLSRRSGGGGGGQGIGQGIDHSALQPEGSVASDSMLSAVGGAPSDVPAVTSVPVSGGFPPISAAAAGSPQQPSFAGIKPEPTGDTALVRSKNLLSALLRHPCGLRIVRWKVCVCSLPVHCRCPSWSCGLRACPSQLGLGVQHLSSPRAAAAVGHCQCTI